MTLRIATLLLIAAALQATTASAVPIMQESFYVAEPANPAMGEYDAGRIDPGSGQNPNTIGSADSAWNADNTGTIELSSSGLTYPGALATGGKAFFEHYGSLHDARTGRRTLTQSYDLNSPAYYVSGLMSFDADFGVGVVDDPDTVDVDESSNSFYSTAYMGFTNQVDPYDNRTTTDDPYGAGGALILGTQWGFQGDGAGGVNAMMRIREASDGDLENVVLGSGISAGTHQFVFKIEPDYSGSSERITAWLNPPSLNSEAAAGTPTLGPSLFSNWSTSNSSRILDTLSISARNVGPNAQIGFDEFRFGTSWEDVFVTPEQHVGFQEDVQPTESYQADVVFLRESVPNAVADGADSLFVGRIGEGDNTRALLGFDLSSLPEGADIRDVTLTLFGRREDTASADEEHTLTLHELVGTFDEATASWNNRFEDPDKSDGDDSIPWSSPGGDFDATVLSALSANPKNVSESEPLRFTSTQAFLDAVQQAVDSTGKVYLLVDSDSNADDDRGLFSLFQDDASSALPPGGESVAYPLLTINYAVPEPSSVLLLALAALGLLGRRRR